MLADIPVHRPSNLVAALELLADPPGGVRPTILAGGTDLMVLLNSNISVPEAVLDILGLNELRGIRPADDGRLQVGALTTFRELQHSEDVARWSPNLVEAAQTVGAAQIQARATLGGNVANASPAGDSLPVLLAQGAEVVLRSRDGERQVPFDSFYAGYRQPDIRAGELVVSFRLEPLPVGARCFFRKVGTRLAQAISKVVVAGVAALDDDGRLSHLKLAAGSVAAVPLRLPTAEQAGLGRSPAEALDDVVEAVRGDVAPIDDIRSTADYRREVTARLVGRFLSELG
jgi:CO/xanthine dehydrogenase FAD-binding subunit